MGTQIKATVEVDLRNFSRACEALGLPKPVGDGYYATVDKPLFKLYTKKFRDIWTRLMADEKIDRSEVVFIDGINVMLSVVQANEINEDPTLWGDDSIWKDITFC